LQQKASHRDEADDGCHHHEGVRHDGLRVLLPACVAVDSAVIVPIVTHMVARNATANTIQPASTP
jgi:hypothetical protein